MECEGPNKAKKHGLISAAGAKQKKKEILKLSARGQEIANPRDIVRDPYIFEFLKIPEQDQPSELELKSLLCNNLQQFLLELGKGFTYVGRQYRMTINNKHHRVDLVLLRFV